MRKWLTLERWVAAAVLCAVMIGRPVVLHGQELGPAGAPLVPSAAVVQIIGPEELLRAFGATGQPADAAYFGAYSLTPVGERLFVGLGAARPGEYDGGLLAEWTDGALRPAAVIDEQGFMEAQPDGDALWIPGPDATDDWSAGNVYRYDLGTGQLIKRRTLPNVIHVWGLYRDAAGLMYVAVGRHLGDNQSWAGGVFRSDDDGLSWELDSAGALGGYRTYDVLGNELGFAAVAADNYTVDCPLVIKPAGGAWQRPGNAVLCRARLALEPSGRRILAVGAGRSNLVDVFSGRRIALPGFLVADWAYHALAHDGRTLYVLADDGRIMATRDLLTWMTVTDLKQPLVSVAYWPARRALVVASRGAAGGVFLIPAGGYGRERP